MVFVFGPKSTKLSWGLLKKILRRATTHYKEENTPVTETLSESMGGRFAAAAAAALALAPRWWWGVVDATKWVMLFDDVSFLRNGRGAWNFFALVLVVDWLLEVLPAKCVKLRDMLRDFLVVVVVCEKVECIEALMESSVVHWCCFCRSITARICSPLRRIGCANWSKRVIETARPLRYSEVIFFSDTPTRQETKLKNKNGKYKKKLLI